MNYKSMYDEFSKARQMVATGEIKLKDRSISEDVGGILARRRPKARPIQISPQEKVFQYFNEMSATPPEATPAPEERPWEAASGNKAWRDAIADIESRGSGGYSAVGAAHKTLGRPLGRYQIMEANIPSWSKAALGREVTVEEFMENPDIQDAIFDHRFGKYVEKYGEEKAARAWFGGEGGIDKTHRTDVHGKKTIGSYGETFMKGLMKRRGKDV